MCQCCDSLFPFEIINLRFTWRSEFRFSSAGNFKSISQEQIKKGRILSDFLFSFMLQVIKYVERKREGNSFRVCSANMLIRFVNFLIVARPSQVQHETLYANQLLLSLCVFEVLALTFRQWMANIWLLLLQHSHSRRIRKNGSALKVLLVRA